MINAHMQVELIADYGNKQGIFYGMKWTCGAWLAE